ncbi:MAG: DUF1501 domain-containing protein [Planctomycetaceae bacterium]|nr:DUF1501 domain-containing protein [Planctomycetaceae bacterium]
MLSIAGRHLSPRTSALCDGVSRRDLLRAGTLAIGGLTLPQLLQAEQSAGVRNSRKAVIMIYMCGAPGHQDMYDLKMTAPDEIRGEFRPIPTNVPGIEICEHMPRLAAIMDKCIPLRSVYGSPNGAHDSFICYTGRTTQNQPAGGWPSMGSVVSKVLGPKNDAVPPFVGLAPDAGHPPYGSPGLPGFLGVAHAAFRPSGPARDDMKLQGIDTSRLDSRKALLTSIDGLRRDIDASGTLEGMDALTQQAFDILTSTALADALDVSRESQSVRDRYGKGDEKRFGDGAPRNLEHFLMARRLVEAGCRVVTLNFGRWDFHSDNFNGMKKTHLPQFDQGLSALIEDLHERGMADDVAVIAWGEFGRTPRINKDAGRDHWPQVGGGLLAGGGFRSGQVIGATDRLGAEIADRPVHFGEVLAALYRHLGIDPDAIKLTDLTGRPQYLLDKTVPMPELV